jgi:hypothetical protein
MPCIIILTYVLLHILNDSTWAWNIHKNMLIKLKGVFTFMFHTLEIDMGLLLQTLKLRVWGQAQAYNSN